MIKVSGCEVFLIISVGGSVNGVLFLEPENCTVEVCTQNIDFTVIAKAIKIDLQSFCIFNFTHYSYVVHISTLSGPSISRKRIQDSFKIFV